MALPLTVTGLSFNAPICGPFKVAAGTYTGPLLDTGATLTSGIGTAKGTTGAQAACGQTFTTVGSTTINSVTVNIYHTGTVTDGVFAEIRATDPSGSLLATSSTVSSASITGTNVATSNTITFTFTTPATIGASTSFGVAFKRTGATDTVNYYAFIGQTTSSYAGGVNYNWDGTTWTTGTGELRVIITGPVTIASDAYYCFGQDGTTATTLQAFKATAPDTSWASVTTKTGFATGVAWVSGFQVGTVIHLAIGNGAGAACQQNYVQFDANTDTFGASETIISAITTAGGQGADQLQNGIVVRSTGEAVVIYNAAQVSANCKIAYKRRTGIATWGTEVILDPLVTTADWIYPRCVLGASDAVHFFWGAGLTAQTDWTQRSITSANVLQTANNAGVTAVSGPADTVSYISGATTKVVSGIIRPSNYRMMRFDSAAVPTISQTTSSAATWDEPGPRLYVDGTDVYALVKKTTDSDLYVTKSSDHGATWGTEVSTYVGTVSLSQRNLGINGQVYTRGGNVVIGYFVWDSGTTLKYNEYVIRTATVAAKAPPPFSVPRKLLNAPRRFI